MLSFLRKKSTNSTTFVMGQSNSSETTLVSDPPLTAAGKPAKSKAKYKNEPYAAEFTGLSTMGGGMPSLSGQFFVPPPKAKKSFSSGPGSLVASQPFKNNVKASFVDERLDIISGMFLPRVSSVGEVKTSPSISL
ncbi:uncharacterized protein MEPE_01429 [Melanopsichium pennsylvanicum]|uniref:Uncharacterized protein n=2 Tax=Melanopsichium pennsylvanicum TaxID=63383 RepID=A0AAJ5C3N7_9BASI|nr:putative protein [Melanopsichium pennsylvanicum 4]SNX82723.1 uncharacterized protein MEPE_01429 [Melanopsichium pennsylvanicum]